VSIKHTVWSLSAAILLCVTMGCASAYHAYPCGCVPYGYCPEPPLPFMNYCGCPTPQAAKYRCQHPVATPEGSKPLSDSPASR
jgi:hypothetical protein